MKRSLICAALAVLVIALLPVWSVADNCLLCSSLSRPDVEQRQNVIHACLSLDVLFHPLETIPSSIPSRAPPV